MTKLLFRYLGSSYIVPFLASASFFILFLLTFQMFKVMRLVVSKGVETTAVLELLGFIALTFIPMAIPLAVLFSTIFTMNKLSGDSEFIAMRSIGLSKEKLILPFLFISLVIGASTFSMNSHLVPHAKKEFKKALAILTSSGLVSEIQKGNFFTDIPNVILFAENVTKENILQDVFINIRSDKDEKAIFAKEGELIKEKTNKWGLGEIRMVLRKGSILTMTPKRGESEKILFQDYNFPIIEGGLSIDAKEKSSMKSTRELWRYLNSPLSDKVKKSKDFIKGQVEFYSRLNLPFLIFIFTLLGFSLGIQRTRGRDRGSASKSLLILAGYYTIFFAGVSLARSHVIPAWFAVLFPTLLGLSVGVYFFRKLEWVS